LEIKEWSPLRIRFKEQNLDFPQIVQVILTNGLTQEPSMWLDHEISSDKAMVVEFGNWEIKSVKITPTTMMMKNYPWELNLKKVLLRMMNGRQSL
jgi:hypothetical protein